MPRRFAPLPDDARVVRFVKPGGGHLPKGCVLPLPGWLAPNQNDKYEAGQRGRPAGLSVWDLGRATVPEARALAKMHGALAFAATAQACRDTGRTLSLVVDVVRDPLDVEKPKPAWDAHSLIEGLSAPKNAAGEPYKRLRSVLVDQFEPVA